MGFNPFSAVTAMVTPAGTNAANRQNRQNSKVAKASFELFNSFLPSAQNAATSLQDQYNFALQMEPQRRLALQQGISGLQAGMNNNYRGTALRAGDLARDQAMSQTRGLNLPVSAILGAHLAAINRGNQVTANTYGQINDPATMLQNRQNALSMILGLHNQAPNTLTSQATGNAMNSLAQAASMVYGQPQVQVGQPFGGLLSMFGQAAANRFG